MSIIYWTWHICLQNKIYVGIATHDKYLVEEAYKLIEKISGPETFIRISNVIWRYTRTTGNRLLTMGI